MTCGAICPGKMDGTEIGAGQWDASGCGVAG